MSLVVDASSYPDSTIIDALYLDRLRAGDEVPLASQGGSTAPHAVRPLRPVHKREVN